ncbi:hypothetical protein QFZ78_002564 [Paenibacillus sp. V4I5]|nr:hypothetical protein [Paenibacillus sp. V4I5]
MLLSEDMNEHALNVESFDMIVEVYHLNDQTHELDLVYSRFFLHQKGQSKPNQVITWRFHGTNGGIIRACSRLDDILSKTSGSDPSREPDVRNTALKSAHQKERIFSLIMGISLIRYARTII